MVASRWHQTYSSTKAGLLRLSASLILLLVCLTDAYSQPNEYVIDKSSPTCANRGPGNEARPWCNLWALHSHKFRPGAVVSIKAGDYFGNEDTDQEKDYHDGVNIYAGGTQDEPFTIQAWPGDEGDVRVYSGKRDATFAYVFWGGHVRVKGIDFIGHVDLPDTTDRLYSPRMFRFAVVDGPVRDIRFDSVRVLHFQGADDVGLGCRYLDRNPVGECEMTRPAEGWGRGIDLSGISDFAFEDGEITCTDEVGREGLPEIREAGLFMAADGIKAGYACSNVTIRENHFGDCGHNNLAFAQCDSVLLERNFFKNELHTSVGLRGGTGNTVRYNTFAAWEKMRVELRNGGGTGLQLRTSNSSVHHNVFYGGGEVDHYGAITLAGLADFVVEGNEIFNNVTYALNSMSFYLNDKFAEPFNFTNNRIFNNIFVGQSTSNGVMQWESASREAYFEGETFRNEVRNNIFYSLTGDPEVLSYAGPRRTERTFSEDEFNDLEFASGNMFADPGLAKLDFEKPDFHIASSCIAINAGLPIDVDHDLEGKTLSGGRDHPSIGAYATTISRLVAPPPVSPLDGATGLPAYSEFTWRQVRDADAYQFQVAGDTTFENPIFDGALISSSYYVMQEPLEYDSTYYWRVRVSAARGDLLPEAADCTPWSPTRQFGIAVGTDTEDDDGGVPLEFALGGAYPNPFQSSTTIQYTIPEVTEVELVIHDAIGRVVDRLVDERAVPGVHSVEWDAAGLVSGTYFYRLRAGTFDATGSVAVAR